MISYCVCIILPIFTKLIFVFSSSVNDTVVALREETGHRASSRRRTIAMAFSRDRCAQIKSNQQVYQ